MLGCRYSNKFPAMTSLVFAGFLRYRKRRKNLTIVLSLIFFLLFFFNNFFFVLTGNLESYWKDSFNSVDLAVPAGLGSVDLMTPIDPELYFDPANILQNGDNIYIPSSPRLRFGAMIGPQAGTEELENRLVVIGIDQTAEEEIGSRLRICEGSSFSTENASEIILPQSIAGNINVNLGEEVVLAVLTPDGFYNMERARLVGIQDMPPTAYVFGTYLGYVPLGFAQRLMDTSLVSELALRDGFREIHKRTYGALQSSTALYNLSISRAITLAYLFLQIIIVLFLGVFSISIVYQNVVMMNADREAEIGIYLSYGASPSWIQGLMYLELTVYVVYCSLIGGIIGLVVMGGLTTIGLIPVDMVSDVMMGNRPLNLWPSFPVWLGTFGISLLFVLGAAAVPLFRATRISAIVKLFRR